jgi:multidrug efflux pump subunit AcrB
MKLGIAGRIARFFLDSKLTPLLILASMALGVFAVLRTPREEEPQIVVPMVDVFTPFPGASAAEVEDLVSRPLEKKMWEIPGVEYVYSTSRPGLSLLIVRFLVNEEMEDSLVRLYNKVLSNRDVLPPGAMEPVVKPRTIDDVPILALTLWGGGHDGYALRRIALELCKEIKSIPDVADTTILGGLRRRLRVIPDPSRMQARGVSPLSVYGALAAANVNLPAGSFVSGDAEFVVEAGRLLDGAESAGDVVVAAREGRPVRLRDVAEIVDGPEEPEEYVVFGAGPAGPHAGEASRHPAVTVAVAKRQGANATVVASRILDKVEALEGRLLPSGLNVTVTRNYGATAREKSDELIEHLLIATVSVIVLVALALGLRASWVVGVAVPVTLALTLLIYWLAGYTLNRVTLFALIFSIGILVDDAIVVVENIHRHLRRKDRPASEAAVAAVDEVGNPTILATFTVIAAILPMAFVSGLMGPYMRPIPVGASVAMLASLVVAFVVSPWMSLRTLRGGGRHAGGEGAGASGGWYRRILGPMLDRPLYAWSFLGGVALLLLAAASLLAFKVVAVKMLPFDDKSEFQIIVDMPEGTALERTLAAAEALAAHVRTVPEVADYQIYAGTSAPYNFNGLVRHYFLRRGGNVADIQVNLAGKHDRDEQSHDIARRVRPALAAIAREWGARIKIAEIPPGPPVLSTLVLEVYGPTEEERMDVARRLRDLLDAAPGVVDVDWYVEDERPRYRIEVDHEKAALAGVTAEEAARTAAVALGGGSAGIAHVERESEPVAVEVRLARPERSRVEDLTAIHLHGGGGRLVRLSEIVRVSRTTVDLSRYHKNLKPVVYVTADVAGEEESPVYAILGLNEKIAALRTAGGGRVATLLTSQPFLEETPSVKWDGEWQITYEVFRDLGIAFAAVLVLIYILVVAWFQSFLTPLIIMAPIPLTLIGILPAHGLSGAYFTATSMIGFIALAGIIVRNSILLVDFVELGRAQGLPLREAVLQAGAVRFRPIALTAAAVIAGAFVIVLDPIFQGLALSLMAGAFASTALTLAAIPLLYYMAESWRERRRI